METQEQKLKKFSAELETNTGRTVDSFREAPTAQGTMDAQAIENARPINIPNAPEPVVANGVITNTSIPPEQVITEQAPQVSNEANQLRSQISERQDILEELGLGDIRKSFEDLMGKGAFTAGAEATAGIDDKTIALNDINNQLRETDLKFRREREAITTDTTLSGARKNARLGDVSRKQAMELADLSVIQSSRVNDLATTQALVDRKVELQFEPIEQRLKFQQFMFDENKELFNAAETKQFQIKMRDEQVQIDKDKFKFQQLENQKATFMSNAAQSGKSNAYLQSISATTTQEQLLGIPGIGDFALSRAEKLSNSLKSAQLSQISSSLREASNAGALPQVEAEKLSNNIDTVNNIMNPEEKGGRSILSRILGTGIIPSIVRGTGSGEITDKVIGQSSAELRIKRGLFPREENDYISTVENVLKTLTLDTFADAKARGMTFGAMSEGEWKILGDSASALVQRRVTKGDKPDGRVIGYTGSQEAFMRDFGVIKQSMDRRYLSVTGTEYGSDTFNMNEGGIEIPDSQLSNADFFGQNN